MMRERLPLVLSASALLVALLGATPLGHAAGRAIHAVPPFAKTAGYAKFAGDSTKLNGRRSTFAGLPGTIPVVGRNGRLPASIGAVGPQGPQGEKGLKGDQGITGISELETVNGTSTSNSVDSKTFGLSCPAGKLLLGGGARVGPFTFGEALASTFFTGKPANGVYAVAYETTPTTSDWYIDISLICAKVAG